MLDYESENPYEGCAILAVSLLVILLFILALTL